MQRHTVTNDTDDDALDDHRLFGEMEKIKRARVIITVAGMEGALPSVIAGITDIPIVAASTDPCMSCTNRVGIVDQGRSYELTGEDLHRMSVEKTRRLMK